MTIVTPAEARSICAYQNALKASDFGEDEVKLRLAETVLVLWEALRDCGNSLADFEPEGGWHLAFRTEKDASDALGHARKLLAEAREGDKL